MLPSCNNTLAGFLTLLIVGSAALFGLDPVALADSHATPIAECQTIDESRVYALIQKLTGDGSTCIWIEGTDVTLNG